MTESNFEKWLNTKEYIAEEKLLDLTEYLCEIDQKQGFKFRILLGIIEWCVHKIIYKRGLKRNMKLEDQFPTKEQCEKLVKIGVVLDTSQFWVCCGGKWQMGIISIQSNSIYRRYLFS